MTQQITIPLATLEQLMGALEINRVMSVDSDGNYTKEVTPKIITEALTAGRAAIDGAERVEDGWQPIETAPKDMGARLYRVNGFCVQGFVDAADILNAQNDRQAWRKMYGKPTHWMPLPAAPKEQP